MTSFAALWIFNRVFAFSDIDYFEKCFWISLIIYAGKLQILGSLCEIYLRYALCALRYASFSS